MQISRQLIDYYLQYLTFTPFATDEPETLRSFDPHIENMRRLAINKGDLETLKAFFDFAIAHPDFDIASVTDASFFDPDRFREILEYARQSIWGNTPLSTTQIELKDQPIPD